MLIFCGFFCICLGTVGIALPILPTTPFYLLAVFCFTKSSVRFSRWFRNTILYKKYLENFEHNRTMTMGAKLTILIPVSIMIIFALIMVNFNVIRVVIYVLLIVKIWYFIFKIKTVNNYSRKMTQYNKKNSSKIQEEITSLSQRK